MGQEHDATGTTKRGVSLSPVGGTTVYTRAFGVLFHMICQAHVYKLRCPRSRRTTSPRRAYPDVQAIPGQKAARLSTKHVSRVFPAR